MAQPQEVRRQYNALINSGNVAFGVFPNGAAAIALTAAAAWVFGAWVEIVATVGGADVWFIGVAVGAFSAPAADYDVGIGTGAGAAEVSFLSLPCWAPVIFIPFPRLIAAATRIAGRVRTSSGAADTMTVKVLVATGV